MFLQTKAAAAKWPVKEQQLEQLTQAMASCCPTAAAALRQKQQRGLKDLEALGLGLPVQKLLSASPGTGGVAAEAGVTAAVGGEAMQPKKKKKKKNMKKEKGKKRASVGTTGSGLGEVDAAVTGGAQQVKALHHQDAVIQVASQQKLKRKQRRQ
jgi:hypothetical protein